MERQIECSLRTLNQIIELQLSVWNYSQIFPLKYSNVIVPTEVCEDDPVEVCMLYSITNFFIFKNVSDRNPMFLSSFCFRFPIFAIVYAFVGKQFPWTKNSTQNYIWYWKRLKINFYNTFYLSFELIFIYFIRNID